MHLGRHWGAPCVGRPGACWSGAGSGTHAAVGVLGSAPRMHTGGSGCQGHGHFPDGGVSRPWLTCHSRRCQRLLGALRGAGVFPAPVPSRPHCPGGPAGLSSVGGGRDVTPLFLPPVISLGEARPTHEQTLGLLMDALVASKWPAILPRQQVRSTGTSTQDRRQDRRTWDRGLEPLSVAVPRSRPAMPTWLLQEAGRAEATQRPLCPHGLAQCWAPDSAPPRGPFCRGGVLSRGSGALEDGGALGALRRSEDGGKATASCQPLLGWWCGVDMAPRPRQLL